MGGWLVYPDLQWVQPGFHLGNRCTTENAGWHNLPNKELEMCMWQRRRSLSSRFHCYQASPVVVALHVDLWRLPTHPVPKHGLTVLLPQMKGSQALDFLLTGQTAHMGGGLYPHLPQIPYCSPQATKPASQLMNTLWYLPNSGSPYSSRTSSVPHSTHLHRSSVSIAFSAVAQCESATAHHVPTAICPVPFRFQAGLLVPVYEEDKVTICHTPEHRHLSWVTQLFRHAMSVRSVLDAWERHSK